jgi:hypothetical protein
VSKRPNAMSCLDGLLGIHAIEGVRHVIEPCGTHVLLIRLDGDVHAIFVRDGSLYAEVARLRDERWPFLPGFRCRSLGKEMEAAPEGRLVCNFLRRPPGTIFCQSAVRYEPSPIVAIAEASDLIVLALEVKVEG